MQRRQRTHGLLGTAAAAVLLAMTLGLAGCGSDGDDGADGRDGQDGQDGRDAITVTDAAFGVDSPNASLCYSCHQNRDDLDLVRGHIDALGGEMYGFATHLDFEGQEGCQACHGGMRVGINRNTGLPYPEGLSPELHAGAQHQTGRPTSVNVASIDDVSVVEGIITVTFDIADYNEQFVNAEFSIAKWNEAEGSWVSMLQRSVGGGDDALVIRAGNLRFETNTNDPPTAGPVTREDTTSPFVFTFASDNDRPDRWPGLIGAPLDFSQGAVWRDPADLDPSSYCTDAACEGFVQGIIEKTVADASWDPNGTYRIGVTGRDRSSGYVRFAAIADVTLAGGAVASVNAPAPTNQIAQASCNTCHGDRLDFARNDVHGGQRPAVAVCSNCHNPYTYDAASSTATANGWASISGNVMIHKIHTGIEGYTVDGSEYENVLYPDFTLAGNSNCTSCHKGEPGVGFGDGWNLEAGNLAAATACTTCHDVNGGVPVDFDLHASLPPPSSCVNCHEGQFAAGFKQTPDAYHGVSARLEELRIQREEFAFSLVSVEDAVYEGTPVVQWQVLDEQGNPYHLANDISIDGGPRLHIGWGYRDDWTNEGSAEKSSRGDRDNDDNGRPVVLDIATTGDNANTVLSDDGLTAISTFPRLTDDEAGQGLPYANLAAAEEGRRGFVAIHRRVSDNGAIRQVTSLVQPITLGSGEVEFAPARRNTVDATFGVEAGRRGTGCLDCHGTIDAHGGGYIMDGDVQACITCHNAGSHESRNVAAVNGREPRSVDFMYFMHDLHGVGLVSVDDSEGLFPQNMAARCHSCHAGSSNDGNVNGFMNPPGEAGTNCSLCHSGAVNPGRLGVLSDWPGANARYGLRGDGTDGE